MLFMAFGGGSVPRSDHIMNGVSATISIQV
jgi:hypothetical protein